MISTADFLEVTFIFMWLAADSQQISSGWLRPKWIWDFYVSLCVSPVTCTLLLARCTYSGNAPLTLSIAPLLSVQSRCVKCLYYIRPRCSLSALSYLFWQVLWRYLFGWKNGAQHWSRAAIGLDHQLVPLLPLDKAISPQSALSQAPLPSLNFHIQRKNLREEPVPPCPCIWEDKITTRLWFKKANSPVMTSSGHVEFKPIVKVRAWMLLVEDNIILISLHSHTCEYLSSLLLI